MNIRKATENDIDALLILERQCITPPWTEGALLSEIYNNDTVFLVSERQDEDAGQIAGFAVLRLIGEDAELFQIVADLNYRREGIATHLLNQVIKDAKNTGVTRLFLEVRVSNDAAIALYERFGFTSISLRKLYFIEPIEDARVMMLEVKDEW